MPPEVPPAIICYVPAPLVPISASTDPKEDTACPITTTTTTLIPVEGEFLKLLFASLHSGGLIINNPQLQNPGSVDVRREHVSTVGE